MKVKRITVSSTDKTEEMTEEKNSAFYELKVEEEYEDVSTQETSYTTLYKKLAKDTTGHGLPHINDARGAFKVSIWILLTLAAVAWMVYHCFAIIRTYAKYDTSVALKIESLNQLTFPAVTVCNLNPYKASALSSEVSYYFNTTVSETRIAAFVDPQKDEYEEYGFGSTRDENMLAFETATEVVAVMTDANKMSLGHQRDDFIQKISYDSFDVPISSLDYLYNWKYGNCYTFNSGKHAGTKTLVKSATTGPQWGLTMIFNVEQDEYVADLTTEAGVRVLVHDQKRSPFPEEDGIDIPVGFSTSLGLRLTQINRLDGKYGNCKKLSTDYSSINVYEDVYPWHNYTLKGCKKTCYQKQLIETCGCYDYKYLHQGAAFSGRNGTRNVCNLENDMEDACLRGIERKLRNGSLNCAQCTAACQELVYEMTISQATWPAKKSRQSLLQELSSGHAGAQALIGSGSFDDNFAQLKIFYEELNFQSVTESPSYELGQFASDFGGVVGLWVGASVITCFEYIEFVMDLFVLWILKLHKKKTTKPQNDSDYRSTPVTSAFGDSNKS